MLSYTSYPKVWALGHSGVKELLFDDVIVEEKVDGSQFSFGRFEGELKCKSKGAEINVEYPEKMFEAAVNVVKNLPLIDGFTYRAEYLKSPKHNVLAYDRIPKNHLIIFDITTGLEEYLSYEAKFNESIRIGLECVPILFEGKIEDPASVVELLNKTSCLGGQKVEGIVIKNYKRFGIDKKILLGKYVSEAFKEVHGAEWKEANPTKTDIVAHLISSYKTPARWNKAIQHLRELGELTGTPKDIGALIKEVQTDIETEEREEIKNKLYANVIQHIKRGVVGGLPEYYKEHLMKEQFVK
jgi:hypothetical protein